MKLYRALPPAVAAYYEKQADVPKGLKFETVEFAFAASPKADFVAWLNTREEPVVGFTEDPVRPECFDGLIAPEATGGVDPVFALDDAWDALPIARRAHFAALFCEEARGILGKEMAPPLAPQGYGGTVAREPEVADDLL